MTILIGDYDTTRLRQEIDLVFTELADMQMDLDDDPIRFGPKRLNAKVAGCKRLVSRCTEIEINLSTICAKILRKQRVAETELELLMQDLLASDPEVRAGRSVRDREAIANTKLRDELAWARVVTDAVEEIKNAISILKAKKTDLKDTQGRLRDQVRLIQEEIALGSAWGTAPPPGLRVSLPREAEAYSKEGKNAVEVLIDDVSAVMDDHLEEAVEEAVAEEPKAPVLELVADEEVEPTNGKTAPESDEAQDVLDALLGEIPEEPSPNEKIAMDASGLSNEALSGADLDALIDGDWS
jgi:hypothetical protein